MWVGSNAMGMTILDCQHMSCCCFNLRKSIVHFGILEVLEFVVALCSKNVRSFFDFNLI
jgi:hypothetical protein